MSPLPELKFFITCIAQSQIDCASALFNGNDLTAEVSFSVLSPTDTNFAVR